MRFACLFLLVDHVVVKQDNRVLFRLGRVCLMLAQLFRNLRIWSGLLWCVRLGEVLLSALLELLTWLLDGVDHRCAKISQRLRVLGTYWVVLLLVKDLAEVSCKFISPASVGSADLSNTLLNQIVTGISSLFEVDIFLAFLVLLHSWVRFDKGGQLFERWILA